MTCFVSMSCSRFKGNAVLSLHFIGGLDPVQIRMEAMLSKSYLLQCRIAVNLNTVYLDVIKALEGLKPGTSNRLFDIIMIVMRLLSKPFLQGRR
jgi:hypothetical protein